jgi:hypothetical protein
MDSFSFDDELLDELSSIIFNDGADDSNNTPSTISDEEDLAAQIMDHAFEIIDGADLDPNENNISNNTATLNVNEDNTASTIISDEDEDLVAHIMKQIELIDDDVVSKNTNNTTAKFRDDKVVLRVIHGKYDRISSDDNGNNNEESRRHVIVGGGAGCKSTTTSSDSNTDHPQQQPQQSSVAQQNNQMMPVVVFVTVTSPPPQIQIHHNWNVIPYTANGTTTSTNQQKQFVAAEAEGRSRSNNNQKQTNGTSHSDTNKITITNILRRDELIESLQVLHDSNEMKNGGGRNGGTTAPRIENCHVSKKRGRKIGSKNINGKSRRRCGQCKEYQCRGSGKPGRAGCENVGRTIEVFEDTMHGSLRPKHHVTACKSNQ